MMRLLQIMAVLIGLLTSAVEANEAVERGKYIFQLAGCKGCHTDEDGQFVAGGRALETPFGTFFAPNITPDQEYGIGSWDLDRFQRALRKGQGAYGMPYYPVFPYTSYKGMSDLDTRDLFAYLQSLPPVAQPNRPHELHFPFSIRPLMWGWQLLFFRTENGIPTVVDPVLERGAYIVRALAHCGECHTPRNQLGVMDQKRELAGTTDGPDGETVPNITPDYETGVGGWSADDLDALLSMGMLPDGDFIGGSMGEVVDNSTAMLTEEDRAAVVRFLKSLPARSNTELNK